MPNINPYSSTYKMALLCVLYILLDAQFILAGANTACMNVKSENSPEQQLCDRTWWSLVEAATLTNLGPSPQG